MDIRPLHLTLIAADDEGAICTPEFQRDIAPIGAALRHAGIEYSQRAMAFDSAQALGFPLPEYLLPLIQTIGPTLGVVLVAWLQGRAGRKVKIKIGDMEAEGRTPEEIERLLKFALTYKNENNTDTN